MSANFRNPNFLLPNELNRKLPASGAETGSGLTEDRHSLYSMEFDASSSTIINASSTNSGSTSAYTISCWIKPDLSSFVNFEVVIQVYGASNYRTLALQDSNGSSCRLVSQFLSGGWNRAKTTDRIILNDTWQHVAMVDNGTNTAVYLNGSFIENLSNTLTIPDIQVSIGGNGVNGYYEGMIDEVAIFNSALTANEVQALSKENAPANIMALDKKPIAYYPLGEQARDNTNWQFPNEVLQSQVFDFDGSTDYIDLGSSLGVIGTGVRTFSMWLKTSNSLAQTILGTRNYNTDGWVIQWNQPGILFFNVLGGSTSHYSDNKGIYSTTGNAANLTDGNWHHVVIVRAGSGNNKIYVDGVSQTLDTTYGDENLKDPQSSKDLLIGAGYDSGGSLYRFFDGELSNIAIWNSDQSTNIDNIYNNGSPQSSYTTTPTAWYKLNATNTYAGLNPNYSSALSFVGSENDYIDCGDGLGDSLGSYTGTITASAWVNPSSGNSYGVFQIGDSGNGKFTLAFASNNLYLYTDTGSVSTAQVNGITSLLNKWSHIAIVWDNQTSSNSKIYINGVDTAFSGSFATGTASLSGQATKLGFWYSNSYTFTGKLSNIVFYTQAISAEDIKYLYNGGTPQTNISFEPTSWYKLDNLTTGIQDSGSASNNGTNSGATAVSSSVAVDQWNFNNVSQAQTPNYSSALDFDGSSNYINCGNDSSLSFSTSFSLSVWINNWTNDGNCVAMKGDGMTYGYFLFAPHPADLNKFKVWIKTSNNWYSATNDIGFSDNTKWVNLVVCYNSINNSLVLYSNGVPGSVTTTAGTLLTGAQDFKLGVENNTTSFYNGSISNASVWNTALTSAQVQTLYNNGSPEASISHSPISWWKLDNTTTGIQDSGSASNNGTNNGATEIQTNVWTPRLNGESTTLPTSALTSSDLQFESPYSNFSLYFDGTGDKVDFGDSDVFSFGDGVTNTAFSTSIWFKLGPTTTSGIWTKQVNDTTSAEYQIYRANNFIGFTIASTPTGSTTRDGAISVKIEPTLSQDVWYHLVTTYDGTQGTNAQVQAGMKIYLNGVDNTVNNFTNGTFTAMKNGTAPLQIGALQTAAVYDFDGNLDEAAIFNKALTQAEVSQVYNNGFAADLTSLSPVSWWRLGEDAYFVGNDITIPNQISGAPNGTGAGTQTSILVANAPGSYASGVGTNLDVEDRKGEAPESSANSQSINMIPGDIHPYIPGYIPAQVNNIASMNFDGIDENFQVSSGTSFDFGSNPFSFSVWIKRASIGDSNDVVIHLQKSGSTPTVQVRQNVRNIKVDFNVGGSWTFLETSTNKIGNDTNWHHLAVTKAKTSMLVYIDGVVQAASNNGIPATLDAGNGITLIGARGGNTQNWDGDIDEVAVFNYALTPKQIKEDIYNASTTGKTADLNNNSNLTAPVAWYRMGD